MALPKRKTSKNRQATRQSHQGYSLPSLALCPQCRKPKPPHQVCPACGSYRGRKVYEVKKTKR
ncbi:50S ribosomal protein L32 [Dehalococcoidia bacterium]|nr:50S ribosomal protein L32 [Dehalococcoidia bacterium]MCL0087977.1 50S ribosomal protein L32 [Dehalococcoidia bacterium]MCL0088952.1 50S ribosomal protein L32 [Dehalococcoidia bacterium]MCL0097885.1 50S ribosomal protein L32 [Dehalococcoidia bacterium]